MARSIEAERFKDHCLALLDSLDADGMVITRHGRPVAKVLPIESASGELIGALEGKLKIRGDITSSGREWDAES